MGTRRNWIVAIATIAVLILVLGGYKLIQQMSAQQALAAAQEPVEAVASVKARVVPYADV